MNLNANGDSVCDEGVFRPSVYLHTFERGSRTSLYHALTLEKIFGTEELNRIVKAFQGGKIVASVLSEHSVESRDSIRLLVEKLCQLRMLVPLEADEEATFRAFQREAERVRPNTLKLLVTHKCNFDCAYCQIERNMHPDFRNLSMTPEIVAKALELFDLVSSDSPARTVIITGGEPMLNLDTVKYVIETAPQKLGNVRTVFFTNGSLATPTWAQFLAHNNVLVLVSLDGPHSSDSVRRFRGKGDAFDIAMQGYQIYKRSGCQVGISAVVNKANVGNLDGEGIRFFLSLNPDSLGLNFSHYLVDSPNPQMIPMEQYVQKLIGAYKIARKHGLFIEQMSRKIVPFASNTPRLRECSASGLGITVDSRGYVGACKVPMVNMGQGKPLEVAIEQIHDGENGIVFPGWTGRSSIDLPQCQGCFAISMCGGGCAYDSWCLYGDTTQVDPRACVLTKGLFEFLLWDLYESLENEILSVQPLSYLNPNVEQQKARYQEYFRTGKTLSESAGHHSIKG